MSSDSERDRRLDTFDNTFSNDLDDAVERQNREIEQRYKHEFINEMNQAEECAKNGDFVRAGLHRLRAETIHEFLKKWERKD
jgi:hypothetical protein